MEVDVHTALGVGKAHLQQGGDQTTGGDVVTCHDPALLNHLLNSHERISEIFGILDGGHVGAYLAQALGKGGATKALLVKREVDVIE